MLMNEKPQKAFKKFISLLEEAEIQNAERIAQVAFYLDKKPNVEDVFNSNELEERWYTSLKKGIPDYSIYEDDLYISEAWNCWNNYSRIYLKLVEKTKNFFQGVSTIGDLGCGIGFTTASLSCIFQGANVTGTNLTKSNQYKIAALLAKQYNFQISEKIKNPTDLIFASEYFEHFVNPIEHLKEILEETSPKYLVVANTFNNSATGHFPFYSIENEMKDGKETSRMFATTLKNYNYEKIKLGFWNNRPNVWKKVN